MIDRFVEHGFILIEDSSSISCVLPSVSISSSVASGSPLSGVQFCAIFPVVLRGTKLSFINCRCLKKCHLHGTASLAACPDVVS